MNKKKKLKLRWLTLAATTGILSYSGGWFAARCTTTIVILDIALTKRLKLKIAIEELEGRAW